MRTVIFTVGCGQDNGSGIAAEARRWATNAVCGQLQIQHHLKCDLQACLLAYQESQALEAERRIATKWLQSVISNSIGKELRTCLISRIHAAR